MTKKQLSTNSYVNTRKNVALAAIGHEICQRYGDAASEYIKAYNGVDPATGTPFRGLKEISKSRVNNDYEYQNLKQQSGFAAERMYIAEKNADSIVKGNSNRHVHTDDIGKVNDPVTDIVTIDKDGKVITGSGAQMKFTGRSSTPEQCDASARQFVKTRATNSNYEKYKGVDILVPKEQYHRIKEYAAAEAKNLREQAAYLEQNGNYDKAAALRDKADRIEDIGNRTKDSGITSKEALDTRSNPEKYTIKKVANTSHRAGVEQAKQGAIIGASISIVQNVVALSCGDKEIEDVIYSIAVDTATSSGMSYVTGFSGTAIKSLLANSKYEILKSVSRSSLPSMVATSIVEIGKSIHSWIEGEIDGTQFLEEMGEKGCGIAASSLGAIVGQIALPVPVVGALIGSMIGYTISSVFYSQTLHALKYAKIAKNRRIEIEQYCNHAIQRMTDYEAFLVKAIESKRIQERDLLVGFTQRVRMSVCNDDVNYFLFAVSDLCLHFGRVLQFSSPEEFDDFMSTAEPLAL